MRKVRHNRHQHAYINSSTPCSFHQSYINPTTMTTRSSLVRWIASLSLCGLVVFCHGLTTRPLSIRLEESQRVLQNLLSIGTHLQNPALYTPSWADRAQVVPREDGTDDGDSSGVSLVALTDIANAGEVLSLFPIHAIGWRGSTPDNNDWIMTATATESESSFRYIDLNLYDERFFPYPAIAPELRHALFIASDPKQQPLQPGWMGHLALLPDKETNSSTTTLVPNCVAVPLPGVCPICALVSTNPVPKGQPLYCSPETSSSKTPLVEALADAVHEQYCRSIAELQSYLDMAYASSNPTTSSSQSSTAVSQSTNNASTSFRTPFHSINLDYPGMRQVHSDPDIFLIDNFLSDAECDLLQAKALPHLQPSLVKNADTGALEENPSRTNMDCNIPQREAPSIVDKILHATNGNDARQLEILQVLRYQKGQQFRPHTDGFEGPVTACGFHQSGRLVTFFCYLNDVDHGGHTHFTQLDLRIAPRKGMAVCFFPNTMGLEEDVRTEHEGSVAIDPKWLLVTWVWKNFRSDKVYDESRLPPLDEEIII